MSLSFWSPFGICSFIANKKHNHYSKQPKERYFMKQLKNMQIIGIDHGYGVRP